MKSIVVISAKLREQTKTATFGLLSIQGMLLFIFYGAMLRRAWLCHSPSVCLSVTFRYRDHIGWNISKIISRLILISLTLSLPMTSNTHKSENHQHGHSCGTGA